MCILPMDILILHSSVELPAGGKKSEKAGKAFKKERKGVRRKDNKYIDRTAVSSSSDQTLPRLSS